MLPPTTIFVVAEPLMSPSTPKFPDAETSFSSNRLLESAPSHEPDIASCT